MNMIVQLIKRSFLFAVFFFTLFLFHFNILTSQNCLVDVSNPHAFCVPYFVLERNDLNISKQIYARDFDDGSWDNCTENGILGFSFSTDPNDTVLVVNNQFPLETDITLYVWDAIGNQDYCTTKLVVKDCSDNTIPPVAKLKSVTVRGYDYFPPKIHARDFDNGSYHYCSDEGFSFSFSPEIGDSVMTLYGDLDYSKEVTIFITDNRGNQIQENQIVFHISCHGCFPGSNGVTGGIFVLQKSDSFNLDTIPVRYLASGIPNKCIVNPQLTLSYTDTDYPDKFGDTMMVFDNSVQETSTVTIYSKNDYWFSDSNTTKITTSELMPLHFYIQDRDLQKGKTYGVSLHSLFPIDIKKLNGTIEYDNEAIGIREFEVMPDYLGFLNVEYDEDKITFAYSDGWSIPSTYTLKDEIFYLIIKAKKDIKLSEVLHFSESSLDCYEDCLIKSNFCIDLNDDRRTIKYQFDQSINSNAPDIYVAVMDKYLNYLDLVHGSITKDNLEFRVTDSFGEYVPKIGDCYSDFEGELLNGLFICLDTVGHPLPYSIELDILEVPYYVGITTLDLVLLQKHLLDLGPLNLLDQIAADLNCNKEVSITDLIIARGYILGALDELPCGQWVAYDTVLQDQQLYFPKAIDSLPDHNLFALIQKGKISGVYLDDENEEQSGLRNTIVADERTENILADTLKLTINKTNLIAGETAEILISSSSEVDILGYQLAMYYDSSKIQIEDIQSLENGANVHSIIHDDEFRILNTLYFASDSISLTEKSLIKLKIKAKRSALLQNVLHTNIFPMKLEATDFDYNPIPLVINFVDSPVAVNKIKNKIEILAVPNPFTHQIIVSVSGIEEDAELILYNRLGQLIYSKKWKYNGEKNHKVLLDGNSFTSEGLYTAVVRTENRHFTFKLVKSSW